MKLISSIFALSVLLSMTSCEKEIYGCTDQGAENYSNMANQDDGSCVYPTNAAKSTTATVSNWTINGTSYVSIIPWGEITADVIENGAVMVYKNSGTNIWSQLPLTIYTTDTYSTTIEVSVTVGQVIIYFKNSDLTLPTEPTATEFKISVVS